MPSILEIIVVIVVCLFGGTCTYLGRHVNDPTWRHFARKRDIAMAGSFFVGGGSLVFGALGALFL